MPKSKPSVSFVNPLVLWSVVHGHRGRPECLPAEVGPDHPGGSLLPPRGLGCSCGGITGVAAGGGGGEKKKRSLDSEMQQDSVRDETSANPILHRRSPQHAASAFTSLFFILFVKAV